MIQILPDPLIEAIWDTFGEAELIRTVSQTADQDGYDGGWIVRTKDGEEWFAEKPGHEKAAPG